MARSVTLVLALCAAKWTSARAASFDCVKARDAMGRAICADARVSALDEQLAKLYAARMAEAGPDVQDILRDSERQWLRTVRFILARLPNPPRTQSTDAKSPAAYLQSAYQDRIAALTAMRRVVGGTTFYVVPMQDVAGPAAVADAAPGHEYDDPEDPDGTQSAYGATLGISVNSDSEERPFIAHAANAAERAFNTYVRTSLCSQSSCMAEAPQDPRGINHDDSGSVAGLHASATVISFQYESQDYPHGAAHGMPDNVDYTFLLGPRRKLQASDVFRSSETALRPVLTQLLTTVKNAYGYPMPPHCDFDVMDTRFWQLTSAGLAVTIPLLACGDYASSGATYIIPWAALAPWRNKTPPFAMADLPDLPPTRLRSHSRSSTSGK
jgi:uncharacterized protein